MAVVDVFLEHAHTHPLLILPCLSASLLFLLGVYRAFLHPLSRIPGPFLPKITSLWLYYHAYIGDEATVIHEVHARYGSVVRVSPNEIDIGDADAIAPIYIAKGGFAKAPCYANFDIDGHKTIFSTTDIEYRTSRAKAVVPLFSTRSIREKMPALYECVDRMVRKMEQEARTAKPVNLLNLTRSLAVDVVSTHLFNKNYDGTSETGSRLSVSAFVDAFVAVGRFFYLPNTLFTWLEWAIDKCLSDEHTQNSMAMVEKFAENLVNLTTSKHQNYQGVFRC